MQYQAVKYFNYFSKNEDYNGFQQEKPIIVFLDDHNASESRQLKAYIT